VIESRTSTPSEIYVTPARCTGCLTCQVACAIEHSQTKTLFGAITQTPPPRRRIFVEHADGLAVPVACRHCDEAFCLNACITGAISRDERGYVLLDESRCIGCNSCIMLCPFGVIQKDEGRHVAVKCDLCPERESPACVDACPTNALRLLDVRQLTAERRAVAAAAAAAATTASSSPSPA
jgi:carbon-monoxide dehydrogenase iron sulfur subunit